jgi:hypothetical protein
MDRVFLEGQLGGNLRTAELLTHFYYSVLVAKDPPKFGELLPSKSQTPAALGGRKEGNTSLMLHAFVMVFASIIGHTPKSEAGSIISTSQVTEVARAKVQSQVPKSAMCGKWGRVLLVYLQCICYRGALKCDCCRV